MNQNGYEIERKFLIRYPDTAALTARSDCTVLSLTQVYLAGGGRVRKIVGENGTTYIKTVKKHITDLVREENEWKISEVEYLDGVAHIAADTHPICKTRYCVAKDGFVYEIDVFPFWNDRAFLEVELTREDEQFPLPDFVQIIKEITDDRRYRNSALAKSVVNEALENA